MTLMPKDPTIEEVRNYVDLTLELWSKFGPDEMTTVGQLIEVLEEIKGAAAPIE